MAEEEWYIIDNVIELDTPALVVYPDRVRANIQLAIDMIGDVSRLRPHVKTHKSKDVSQLMFQAGITKFKCATIAEAEMLGICKAPDVLLAYQPAVPKLNRLLKLIDKYPQTVFSCLVDNEDTAQSISAIASDNNVAIPVYIDLNIGMNRTGILPGDALALYKAISDLAGIEVIGLHAYDGHIHGSDYNERKKQSDDSITPVLKLADAIGAAGYLRPTIIAGGSPTYPIMLKRDGIECSPGTFAYWDKGYQLAFPEQPFLTAALVVGRVVSLPDDRKLCIDIGHKSVASENELARRIYFLNAPELNFTGHSEEHLMADAGAHHKYKVGDILYGLPYHICPTVALYERAYTVKDHFVKGEWFTTARDRKITM